MTSDQVLDALRHVIEPDLGRDLVSLDMVKDVQVEGMNVSFTVVLTTPACPLKEHIRSSCVAAVHEHVSPQAQVVVNTTADVTTRKAIPGAPGPAPNSGSAQVRNIIAVASGKGGVGKSTLSVNLALALAQAGATVGLVDVDIHGPSIPTMLDVPETEKPRVNAEKKIEPLERHGIKLLSMGFLVDPKHAVIWRGPMASSAVRQFLNDANWGELDYLILDLPPGTGDIQLTIVQTVALTGAVIISTPQTVALDDARRGVAMFNNVNVPVLGIVENMAYFTPPDLPDRKYHLFGQGGARRLAEELNVPFLGEIPIQQSVREGGDAGQPVLVAEPDSLASEAFRTVAERAAQQIAIRNAELDPTQKIEILYR